MIYLVTEGKSPDPQVISVISVDKSLMILNFMRVIGVDTETSGLDCHNDKLLSIQFGNINDQIVVDCTTIDIAHYKGLLEDKTKKFLFWNAKFDLKFLYSVGIVPYNVYDGFLAEKLMWLGYPSGAHSMSLKSASINYLGIDRDKTIRGKVIWNGLKSIDTIVYAAEDVQYLESIMNEQIKILKEKELLTAIEYENKFVIALAYEEWCGIKIDIDKWKAKMVKDNIRLEKAKKALDEWLIKEKPDSPYVFVDYQGDLFNGYNTETQVSINWNSANQVIPILKEYGVEIEVKDKVKGGMKDSIDAKVLKPQKSKCSLIPLLLDYKEAVKVTSTYGDNVLKQIDKKTGRLYTQFNQLGADTTRITSGGKDKSNGVDYINLLNMPRDAETRSCFVAEKGNKWISIDYSGQESYLLASIANDEALIHELTEGSKDVHSLVAYMSYKQIPRDTPISEINHKYHDLRQEAKGIEFAINYAGDANTIANNKGIPLKEAQEIYDAYMNGFKGVKKYQDIRKKEVMEKGYILLNPLTGHKAYIYDFNELKSIQSKFCPEFWSYYGAMKKMEPQCDTVQEVKKYFKRKATCERASVNFPIQGTGSLCLRVSMVNFFEYLRKKELLFKVNVTVTPYDRALS